MLAHSWRHREHAVTSHSHTKHANVYAQWHLVRSHLEVQLHVRLVHDALRAILPDCLRLRNRDEHLRARERLVAGTLNLLLDVKSFTKFPLLEDLEGGAGQNSPVLDRSGGREDVEPPGVDVRQLKVCQVDTSCLR